MADFDISNKRITAKIVYYGPALSGKTTNLMCLFNELSSSMRGDLMTLDTHGDRTIFFDLLPVLAEIGGGVTLKIKLFTVPGQARYDATRKTVLSRADGVAFIADSQRNQALNNYESFINLEKNVARVGLDFENLPLVIQFNKIDLKDIISQEEIDAQWKESGLHIYLASALYKRGVKETFRGLLKLTLRSLEKQFSLKEQYGYDEKKVIENICGTDSIL